MADKIEVGRLLLSRRPGEAIMIGHNIEVKVMEVRGNQVKLSVDAPKAIPVDRKEIYLRKRKERLQGR